MDTKKDFSGYDVYVVGAGAIGQVMTAMLHQQGINPTLIARESTLKDIRDNGYVFVTNKCDETIIAPRTLAYSEIPSHDPQKPAIIFYAPKASYLPQAIKQILPIIDSKTQHVFLQGGIPWWFGHALDARHDLSSVTDPNSQILKMIGSLNNVHVGMIKFGAGLEGHKAELKGNGDLTFGSVLKSPDNQALCHFLKEMFVFDRPLIKPSVTDSDLTQTVWTKAAGSFSMSAFAMITNRTLGKLYNCLGTRTNMVEAAKAIVGAGNRLGIFEPTPTDWNKYFEGIATSKPDHMMSITKDPSEITQIIEWPMEIRRSLGLEMELMNNIYGRIPEKYKPAVRTQGFRQDHLDCNLP